MQPAIGEPCLPPNPRDTTVPFKTNADRRHHIPKQRHQVTNWREYDAALRQRGSLTVLCGRPSKGNRGRRLARASHYFLRGPTIARTWLAKVRDLARDPAVRAAATAVP